MSKQLENQVALVTGGSTGIGAAVAQQLAALGAKVVITGRHEDTLKATAEQHPHIGYVVADVSRPAEAVRAVEEVRRRHGRLDVLVNNAGIAPPAPLADATPAHVRELFETNVFGLIETTRAALPFLRQAKGNVVNVASIVADQPFAHVSTYAATKAAVVALTRAWAKELAGDGVRVNAVSPGPIETPIFGKMGVGKEQRDQFLQQVPLKRFGKPEEVAVVVGFLASSDASFVTGAQYKVGGGLEA
ncbi:MAG TPA: SDR family oxidoreductase [Anaeromyxobacteraceae bacterium]|nr:SDR family oxidoreductase [Anaeromyxobacteraceae bacterium]